jgi:hypothetical protein
MNFKKLYDNNKAAVERALVAMWCGESNNESQTSYIKQMKKVIGNLFAPDNAVPVVQCMNSYLPVHSVSKEEAKSLVGTLWTKSWSPYEHQYQSWKTLLQDKSEDGKPMSIVVTTGTGSGKTECFMMPLVYDLLQNPKANEIQALFLYPLNALMEDQKQRLEELLCGTNLSYAVYNGDLPEIEPQAYNNQPDAQHMRRRIEQITGGKYVEQEDENHRHYWQLTDRKYKHMLYTRRQVRDTPPNILLTNPTMLEYILLRGSDAALTDPEKQSLKWVAIDETHTYTGAGAAEMAMLLRRVLLAFNVSATNVHFATSSATFGNGKDDEEKLREFIAGITGTSLKQVKAIGGKRVGEDYIPSGEDEERWKQIFDMDYIELDKLFPGNESISDKLQLLDDMCQREEVRCKNEGKATPDMKLKVHYFHRVPNNGLYVRLTEHEDGSFKIYTQNSIDKKQEAEAPLLELSRCKHCGEYVAVARVNTKDWSYEPLMAEDSDMFDLVENEDDESGIKYAIFGLSKNSNMRGDNNVMFTIAPDGKLQPVTNGDGEVASQWHIVGNTHCCCPYCNSKQSRTSNTEKDVEGDANGNMADSRLMKFRLSADFISRMMAPAILDQLDKYPEEEGKLILHDGQQYISFVDSRQAAAKATLRQDLSQERIWFYSIVYHEMCRRKAETSVLEKQIKDCTDQMHTLDQDSDEYEELFMKRKKLRKGLRKYMTWEEISEVVLKDKYCPVFCNLFVKRTSDSEELEDDGSIKPIVMEQYVQSIMVMYLANRVTSIASPETMGLFHTCYPQLSSLELPEEVKRFNELFDSPSNQIMKEDWHNLIQIFMDYTVRSNQSYFLKISEENPIDIFSSVRFATEKQRRRPVNKPKIEKGKITQSRIVRFLCGLIVRDDNSISLNDAQNTYFREIEGVINALWDTITDPNNKLLEIATRYDADNHRHVVEKDNAPRLNLINLSFELYDDVYLCDTNADNESRHVVCLRPIANNFKRFAPYLSGSSPVELKEEYHQHWTTYPNYKGSGKELNKEKLNEWAKVERSLLWNNKIWGEDGVFMNYLEDIHLFPNLFIQAEHTAQVDKDVARGLQSSFKEHTINILACSTTMEMGVDLGNLEVVLLSSVPPMPANYKQRAGRSGRNNKVRSACITLCGSDAIGLRTLYNPVEKIINRAVRVPTIDLKSPQVVQRHVNSFLIRTYGVFTDGDKGGSLNQKVVDYYTPFSMIKSANGHLVILDSDNHEVDPSYMMGDSAGTMYERFNDKCLEPISSDLRDDLNKLLKDTIFENQLPYVISQAREINMRCYSEIYTKLEDYKFAYTNTDKERFRVKLKMQYMEVMNEKLLNFWATHRFTPNANMPVNVLTLDLNSTANKSFFTQATTSNPSYSLREAIAQYAPGNSVAVDGVVYIVRGIEFANIYEGKKAFKTIYRNADKTVVDDASALTNQIRWWVNNKEGLELIQPVSFLPDMNEDKSRIMDSNVFTRVSAQLIDTDDWTNIVTEPHLFSVRSNRETGNAKILYYNEGKGYGYCFCPRCGRMVLEDEVANEDEPNKFPYEFNPVAAKRKEGQPDKPNFHFAINGKDYRKACSGSNKTDVIKRNVIIGDLIQTDYSEIRLRHKGKNKWMSERSKEENLLFTLGIVFSQTLVDTLGKERGAVDFAIMPNGHLCIFDTNPGGAGYANQLSNIQIMKEVIKNSKILLEEAKAKSSKDMLLDKFTLRYVKYIDIEAALDWIKEEEEASDVLPEPIAQKFPTATETSLNNMLKAFSATYQEATLFINDEFKDWDYSGLENGWRQQLQNHFVAKGQNLNFCMMQEESSYIAEPVLQMIREMKAWTKDFKQEVNPFKQNGLYPIAYIDDCLYFTNNKEYATLNDKWGNGTLYVVRTQNPCDSATSVDTSYRPSTMLLKLSGSDYETISTKQLGGILQQQSNGLIDQFIDYAKQNGSVLKITYQDEHLKSVLGMVVTLQTIDNLVKQIGSDFSLKFMIEKYEDNRGQVSFSANLPSHRDRDQYLDGLTRKWIEDLAEETSNQISGKLEKVESQERKTLTHWRVLTIECGDKRLSIYPDGGFLNGWVFKKNTENHVRSKFYTNDNTDATDDITLRREHDIKYDITIESC